MHPSINILRSYEELEDDGFEEKVQWAAQDTSVLRGGFLQLMKWWIPCSTVLMFYLISRWQAIGINDYGNLSLLPLIWPSHGEVIQCQALHSDEKGLPPFGVDMLWNMILITEPFPQYKLKHDFLHCVCGDAAIDADIQNCASAGTLPIITEVENHPIVEVHGSRFPLGPLDPGNRDDFTLLISPHNCINLWPTLYHRWGRVKNAWLICGRSPRLEGIGGDCEYKI